MTDMEFSALLDRSGPALYRFCRYLTADSAETEDLYQETCLKGWEKRGQIHLDRNPEKFLIALAAGIWKNHRRKLGRRSRRLETEIRQDEVRPEPAANPDTAPEAQLLRQEKNARIRREVMELDSLYRIPVYLYYGLDWPIQEIAALLHIPSGTVKSRLSRARDILRQRLEEYEYDYR